MSQFAFLDWPAPIPFAHRGATGNAPGNTMLAFEAAISLGYRYIETDVRATLDGRLVTIHDKRLDSLSGHQGPVADLPWSTLRQVRLDGREPIPLLEEVLHSWPDVRLNIDPKTDSAVAPLISIIQHYNAVDRVCIGSFSSQRINEVRSAFGQRLCTSMGPRDAFSLFTGSRFGIDNEIKSPLAQLPTRVGPITVCDKRLIEYAHRNGMRVHGWTVNGEVEMTNLLDFGIDGLITDSPELLKEILRERGQWHAS